MTAADSLFAGSIPGLYHHHLGPLLFEPYALDIARRAGALRPGRILETAAGTGIVTGALMREVPEARIVATDLNQAMLDLAAARLVSPRVEFRQADAQDLPFEAARFDAVVCQFGAMFFPDRIAAYREARRVLAPGGSFLLNVWDRLEKNVVSKAVAEALAGIFPDSPPGFLGRVPFGYHDRAAVEADLRAAGFTGIAAETLVRTSPLGAPRETATGLCQGSPLKAEIEAHGEAALERATEAVAEALARLGYGEGAEAPMSAHVFVAHG